VGVGRLVGFNPDWLSGALDWGGEDFARRLVIKSGGNI